MSTELTAGDLRTILDIVREVTGADTLADFRSMVPELVLGALPGSLAGYNEIDVGTGEAYVSYYPESDVTAQVVERFAQYALDHPTLQHIVRTGDGSAVTISDVISRAEYRASRLYQECFLELGVEDQIVIALPAPQPLTIGIPVNRDEWGFQPRERELLNELRPHLAQAHATAATRDLLHSAVASRDAVLERTGNGVIRLHRGTVVDASPVARRWLDRGLLDGGRLAEDLRGWYVGQRSRLDGQSELPEVATPFRAHHDDGQATVRLIDADTMIVQEVGAGPGVEQLRRFGLSAAEAAVLARVVQGLETEQIAAELHVTTGTVRKHLQSVFRKLGVHSRAAAVALALGGEPVR